MKIFTCSSCQSNVFFENSICVTCGHPLGYDPASGRMVTLEALAGLWVEKNHAGGPFIFCDNATYGACNWLTPAGARQNLCVCCMHNQTVPDFTNAATLKLWQRIETAKHHLFYALRLWNLPMPTRSENPATGLAFDFLAEVMDTSGATQRVITGHDNGLITLNISEADDVERERHRTSMGEPYRTLLGHFRHEIGHYYWDRLVKDRGQIDACRFVFGDESQDYGLALQNHYANGAPADWQNQFISAYASAHPWEDFAETFSHYMHIVDALETAHAYSINLQVHASTGPLDGQRPRFNAYHDGTMDDLLNVWVPLTIAMNSLNRSMGQRDFYPFVMSQPVVAKLSFIHQLVRG